MKLKRNSLNPVSEEKDAIDKLDDLDKLILDGFDAFADVFGKGGSKDLMRYFIKTMTDELEEEDVDRYLDFGQSSGWPPMKLAAVSLAALRTFTEAMAKNKKLRSAGYKKREIEHDMSTSFILFYFLSQEERALKEAVERGRGFRQAN